MTDTGPHSKIRALPVWQGDISIEPLTGGITNENYLVQDASRKYVVRVGADIPLHQVMRFNELAAARAAHAAGLSPAVVHASGNLTVLDYIDSRTLRPEDIRTPEMLPRVLDLVKRCHVDVPKHFRGPALVFWVFHVIRDYASTLKDRGSAHISLLPAFLDAAEMLERAAGPFDIVFGHKRSVERQFPG